MKNKKPSKKRTYEEERGLDVKFDSHIHKRGLKSIKKIKKIELAPTDKTDDYEQELVIILKALGHPEALVTDESSVWDFLDFFGDDDEKRKRYNERKIKKLISCVGFKVYGDDLLIDVATQMRINETNREKRK